MASPKDTIRAALKNNLIKDADLWMEFLKMRNLTSHVYLEEYLAQVIEIFDQFSLALNESIKTLDEVLKND